MIRAAEIKDVSRISEINVYGWRNAYRNIISDEILYKELSVEKSIERNKKSIIEGDSGIYVFEDVQSGIVKGMMGFYDYADDEIKNGFELKFIYVETAFCGEGIGSQMINFFESTGIKKNKSDLIIYTIENNRHARSFYEKHGYKLDGNNKKIEWLNVTDIRYRKSLTTAST